MMKQALKIAAVAGCTLGLVAGMALPVLAQQKKLSDKSVKVLMSYAWSLVPSKFTTPNGKVILTDRSKPKLAQVPLDVAREVIRVGRLSAMAQECDLREAQVANYRTLMNSERAKKKWTEQQILFINQLHLLTVMWLSGQAKVVSGGPDKAPKVKSVAKPKKSTCDEARKSQVREAIVKYVKAHPGAKKAAATAPKVQPAKGKAAPKKAAANKSAGKSVKK